MDGGSYSVGMTNCWFVETSLLPTSFEKVPVPTHPRDFSEKYCSKSLGYTLYSLEFGADNYDKMYMGQTILSNKSIKWWNTGYEEAKNNTVVARGDSGNQLNDSKITYYWIAIKYNN